MSHDIAFNVFLSDNSLWTYQLTDTAEDESWYAFNVYLFCGLGCCVVGLQKYVTYNVWLLFGAVF